MMKEYIGYGLIDNLRDCVKEFDHKNILVLHGKGSYESSGAKAAVEKNLSGLNLFEWSDFTANPKWEELQEGLKVSEEKKITLVIAIGGGSAIDMGKLVSIFTANQISFENALIKGFTFDAIPLIAIPTTAGSGSEATQFAVLWHKDKKLSIDDKKLLPQYSIIDPTFIKTQSVKSAAPPLMDALGQAVESYWSINSNDESKNYAANAIKLIVDTLSRDKLTDEDYLMRAEGAFLAGKAINITRTTAAHAVSYAFTAYKNIPHGHAVMLTLPDFFLYNSGVTDSDCLDIRGASYVKSTMDRLNHLLGCKNAEESRDKLHYFMDILGLERDLCKLGFRDEADYQFILDNGFNPQRVKNNPRLLARDALYNILNKRWR